MPLLAIRGVELQSALAVSADCRREPRMDGGNAQAVTTDVALRPSGADTTTHRSSSAPVTRDHPYSDAPGPRASPQVGGITRR